MAFAKITILSMFIASVLVAFCHTCAAENGETYLRDACSVTHYTDVCIHSLASYSHIAKRDPRKWARAGLSVTIGEAKQVAAHLSKLKNLRAARRGRSRVAVLDCIDLLQDTLDNLHKSLGVLRELSGQNFQSQIEDVTTWISAALTDEDTCLDGFSSRKKFEFLQNQVLNATYVTSNALALVNKLGTTGPGSTNWKNWSPHN